MVCGHCTDRRFSFPSSLFSLFSCFYLLFHSMSVKFYPLPFSVTLWCADIALQSVKPPKKKRPRRPKQYCLQLVIYIYIYIYIYETQMKIRHIVKTTFISTKYIYYYIIYLLYYIYIFYYILCCIYLNSTPLRLAMSFAVYGYIIFISLSISE